MATAPIGKRSAVQAAKAAKPRGGMRVNQDDLDTIRKGYRVVR